jgi:iron(III) transport system substrate-binding protein
MKPAVPRLLFAAACAALIAAVVAGCGSSSSSSTTASTSDASTGSGGSLTLYSAQHEQMTEALAKGFEEATGASVAIRYGEDEGLADQIEQEGSASPADVVLTENTPPVEALAEKGLLAQVEKSTLEQVPAQYSSDEGLWVGVAARETVMIYNPDLIAESELPKSILDLAEPQWKGKLAIAPSEPDFVPVVRAVEMLDGRNTAKTWLEGFAANAKHYNDNEGIVAAVDAGQIGAGIINHYYWFEARAEEGASKVPSKLHYFGHEDPGALVDISGAAALASSHDPELERAADGRLRDPRAAAGAGRGAGGVGPGAGGARGGGGAFARGATGDGAGAGDDPAHPARAGRRGGAGLPDDGDRADHDAAAGADRDRDAGDRLLGQGEHLPLRGRRALRGADGRDLRGADLPADEAAGRDRRSGTGAMSDDLGRGGWSSRRLHRGQAVGRRKPW